MNATRTIHSLGVESVGKAYFFEYEEGATPENHFRLETLYSGISTGTELTFLHGTNPYLYSTWDAEYGIFRAGEPSIHYPIPFMGYMEVGRVVESRFRSIQEGDILAMTYGHKSGHTADGAREFYVSLPADIDPILGVYVGQMGPICANGLLHAAEATFGKGVHELSDGVRGRTVVVMGAGVVGLLTALFAKICEASEVVVINNTPERLNVAQALGLTTVSEREIEPWRYCKDRWHYGANDRGADIVFQCKTQTAGLRDALRCLRPQGAVIDLAFYQRGAEDVFFGQEFHHNALRVRSAQISHIPLGLRREWNQQRLAHETIKLLRQVGSLIRTHMITDIVPLKHAPDFLTRMADRYQPKIIQAVIAMSDASTP